MVTRPVVLLVLTLLMISTALPARAMSIPGKLMVVGTDLTQDFAYFMEGTTDDVTSAPVPFYNGDISPSGNEVAYIVGVSDTLVHIWKANVNGTSPVNLTSASGLSGVNCFPRWSPDGSQIAFQHAEPHAGQSPCDAGFHLWLMNADGAGAHPITPTGFTATTYPVWMSNGRRLLCETADLGIIFMDTDGTDVQVVPNVGATPGISPDGSKIVSSVSVRSGSGTYRRLVLTNLDGSSPQVLVERYISDADVTAHLQHIGLPTDSEHKDGLIGNIGPVEPQWAPTGNLIVFSAAMPLDVNGPHYDLQREVWMYSFGSGEATKVTTNDWSDSGFSWHGDNTYPDHPEVTVDNLTLTFSEVTDSGLTTILRALDPPDVSAGPPADYTFYDLETTAQVAGPITICLTYTNEGVPAAAESDLAILRYNEGEQTWEDITTSLDTVNNTICGQTDSLSPIAFYGIRNRRFPDVPAWGYGTSGLDPYWAYYQIMACVDAGVVSGYADGTYKPSASVTRDQMAVYIARALAGGEDNVPAGPATATFGDVPVGYWAYDHIEYCYDENVVQGYTTTTYAPTVQVTRDQMAVYVARALVAPTGEAALADYVPDDPRNFPDVASDFWAYRHIEYCVEHDVVQGYTDGSYHPTDVVTRDQMAVYVARAFKLVS